MDKEQIYNRINEALMEWNPIGVEGPALRGEYMAYVPKIFALRNDHLQLRSYLQRLVDELGLEFDPANTEQMADIDKLARKIMTDGP